MPALFNREEFRDNCGFGLVANINGVKSHKIIINSIDALISICLLYTSDAADE